MTWTRGTVARAVLALVTVGVVALLLTWLIMLADSVVLGRKSGELLPLNGHAQLAWHASLPWVTRLVLWCGALWVATVEQSRRGRRWLPLVVGGLVVVAWTVVGSVGVRLWASEHATGASLPTWIGHAVGWPGPENADWLAWTCKNAEPMFGCWGSDQVEYLRPAAATPLIILAALCASAVLAARSVPNTVPSSSTRTSRTLSAAVLGSLAFSCLVAAALLGAHARGGPTSTSDVLIDSADWMPPVVLAALVAVLCVGAGPLGWAVTALSLAGWTWTAFDTWWEFQRDGLLGCFVLGTAAPVVAALVVPTSRAMGRLERGAPAEQPAPLAQV